MTSPDQEDVRSQLAEKDQLIQTLTERLSEVAEQLDRARRSGGDRNARRSAPNSEVFEQQRQLTDNLSQLMELWDGLQPRDAFGRLEARLDAMRTLLESVALSGVHAPATDDQCVPTPATPPPRREDPDNSAQDATGWEAMKAQLLGATEAARKPTTPPDHSVQSDMPGMSDGNGPSHPEPSPNLDEGLELPKPVAFEDASREDLEQAIEVRDHFIGVLSRRLRNEQQRTREATDWESLNNAPTELCERLKGLEADLVDRLRIAEVELSLERARLSRVQSRVQEMQREVESRMKASRQLGSSKDESAEGQTEPKGWLNQIRRR